MTRNDLQKVMTTAWSFVKTNKFTLSEALRVAWRNYKLCKKMTKGVVAFMFRKVDNTIRKAYGTLSAEIIPQTNGSGRKANDSVQTYYDCEKNDWRCYKKSNLMFVML